jgi:hypothetical protein
MPSTSRKRPKAPPLVGWREWAALPTFCDHKIKAKLDTGAKMSAIHAFRIEEIEEDDGLWVEFYLHPAQKRRRPEIFCRAPVIDRRLIRSSNGAVQERLIVTSTLQLGGLRWPIEISLANRDDMGFRLLLGRDALRRRVTIDPARSFVLGD